MHSCNKIVLTYRSCGRLRQLRFEGAFMLVTKGFRRFGDTGMILNPSGQPNRPRIGFLMASWYNPRRGGTHG